MYLILFWIYRDDERNEKTNKTWERHTVCLRRRQNFISSFSFLLFGIIRRRNLCIRRERLICRHTTSFFRLRFLSINFPSPLPTLEISSLGNPIIQSTVLLLCTTRQRFRDSETNYLLCFHGRSKLAEQVPPHPTPFNYLHPSVINHRPHPPNLFLDLSKIMNFWLGFFFFN